MVSEPDPELTVAAMLSKKDYIIKSAQRNAT